MNNRELKEFKTREEFLQDTINYYWGRPDRTCGIEEPHYKGLICQYAPVHNNTEGCAIGRVLPLELCKELDENNDPVTAHNVFKALPKWMQDLGNDFLGSIQLCHDLRVFEMKDKQRTMSYFAANRERVDFTKITFPDE